MKLLDKILLLSLLYGATSLVGQGEFYTINHDTHVILKSSKKSNSLDKYYSNDRVEDIVIFRTGLDRAIKLKGNFDFVSNNIDFDLSGAKHSIPIENIDSIYVGFIPKDINLMQAKVFVNANVLSDGNDFYLESLEDGKVKLYKRTLIKIRRANYNKALAIGNKEDTYKERYEYYIYTENNKLLELPKLNKSRKNLIRSYNETWSYFKKKDQVDQLLDCENERDLKILIKYLNK